MTDERTILRPHGAEDLIAMTPYLLGFQPSESLVIMWLRDRQVITTARMDLKMIKSDRALASRLTPIYTSSRADAAILVAFSVDVMQAQSALGTAVAALSQLCPVWEAIATNGERWWEWFPDCLFPPAGVAYDLAESPLAAEAVYAGLWAASSRDDLRRSVVSDVDAATRQTFADTIAKLASYDIATRQTMLREHVAAFTACPRQLNIAECVELAVLVADREVRDDAWLRMSREDADSYVDLWIQVVHHAWHTYAVPALCLLAAAAWLSGNGALQLACLDQARSYNIDYSMIDVLDSICLHAIHPDRWDHVVSAVLASDAGAARGVVVHKTVLDSRLSTAAREG